MRYCQYIAIAAVLLCPAIPAQADVTISSAPTANMSCSAGVCTPTAKKAVLNRGDLETLLAAGNVEVTTTGAGVQAGNIDVAAAFAWSSASTLALDAYQSITFNAAVNVTGQAGATLTTNDGGAGGNLFFKDKGSLSFANLASALTINGAAYTLENSIAALASAIAANPAGAYALADNYDASKDGVYGGPPIDELTGALEGLGNTISNFSLKGADSTGGLIYAVETGGTVAGLKMTALDVNTIEGVAAGMVNTNEGTLFNDDAAGKVFSRRASSGGLVAYNNGGVISYSSANVAIRQRSDAGGLVFYSSGTISLSHATGAVRTSDGDVGGLVGGNTGAIDESYATGAVQGGEDYIGGLVAANSGTIANSYATGAVTGRKNVYAGGLLGFDGYDLTSDSYSTGAVSVTYTESSYVGGFVGGTAGSEDCYWDTTTSGTDNGAGEGNASGITGLTTEQLQSGLPAGFDPKIWAENAKINGGLPYLINNPPEKK